MTLSFMNNKWYIFIVRRLGKQSKLILSRLDSISNLKLNLRIHDQCGPYAHAGDNLQAFLIFCFKPILISAHKITLLIYGDNSGEVPRGEGISAHKKGKGTREGRRGLSAHMLAAGMAAGLGKPAA